MKMKCSKWFLDALINGRANAEGVIIGNNAEDCRVRFDSVRVNLGKSPTLVLLWRGNPVMEYAYDKWVDFGRGDTIIFDMLEAEGSAPLTLS